MKKTLSSTLWEYCQRKKISVEEMKSKGFEECLRISKLIGCEPPSADEFKFELPLPKPTIPVVIENKIEEPEMKKILVEIPTRQKEQMLDSRVILTDSTVQNGNNVEPKNDGETLSEDLVSTASTSLLSQKKKKVLL